LFGFALFESAGSRFRDGFIDATVSTVEGGGWLSSGLLSSDFLAAVLSSGSVELAAVSGNGFSCTVGVSVTAARPLFRSRNPLQRNGNTTSPEDVTPIGKQPPGGVSSTLDFSGGFVVASGIVGCWAWVAQHNIANITTSTKTRAFRMSNYRE
jgi:hypothetical protein